MVTPATQALKRDLDFLFKPESIAVVGASDDPEKFSGWIIRGMRQVGYKGRIYPVNPRRTEVGGLKCYESISTLPETPELALIAIPAAGVRDVLAECVEVGVRASIVITAGIKYETTDPEQDRSKLLADIRKIGMRICGPNCEGVIYLPSQTWATFLSHPSPLRGDIAFITQSGGVGEFVLNKLWERQIGTSGWVSSGNELDLQVADYIEYFASDPETKAISVFLEAARNGPKFMQAARLAFKEEKPLVIFKVGKSERGSLTALTHTGAIAGKFGVYMGLFRQLGIIRARSMQELVELPFGLAWLPLPRGRQVAVIADSGGIAALFADLITQEGLLIPDFSDGTLTRLKTTLPSQARPSNPLDITALVGPKEIVATLESIAQAILEDNQCDVIIVGVSYWPDSVFSEFLELLHRLEEEGRRLSKPVIPVFTAITARTHKDLLSRAAELKLPAYLTPEMAVACARALCEYSDARRHGLE